MDNETKDTPSNLKDEQQLFISDQSLWNDRFHMEFSLAYFKSDCPHLWVYCNL